jgi:branched-chain amino acid transport system permease protein
VVQILISAVITGTVYSMLAVGLVAIYRSTRVFNFAHAPFAALGAYAGYAATVTFGLPFWLGALVGLMVGALLGLVIERFLLFRLYGRTVLELVAATFAFAMIIRSVINIGWDADIKTIPDPFGTRYLSIMGAAVPWYGLLLFGIALALVVGLSFVLRRTEMGLALRAAFDDPAAARLQGIRVNRIRTLSWVFGGSLAGLAGVLLTPIVYLTPATMDSILVLAFAAVVIGGMTSFWGAIIGGLTIAIGSNLLGSYVSAEFRDVFLYLMVLVLLSIRPQGLFGDGGKHDEAEETPAVNGRFASWVQRLSISRAQRRGTPGVGLPPAVRRYLPAIVAVAMAVFVLMAPQMFGRSNQTSLTTWMVNAVAVFGSVLVIHYGGRFFLAQNAFMAMGAYLSAILINARPESWVLMIALTVLITAIAGVLFELLTLRLEGAYYALATLILALLAPLVAVKWVSVTGGEDGLFVPSIGSGGASYDGVQLLALVSQIAVITFFVLLALRSVSMGRAIIAVRDSAPGARSIGISPLPRRLSLVAAAAGLGGLAGALSAVTNNVVTPHAFGLDIAFMLFVAAVVAGSLMWSFAGAGIVTMIPILFASYPEISQAIYGFAIILAIFVLPKRRDVFDQLIPTRKRRTWQLRPGPSPLMSDSAADTATADKAMSR